MSRFLLIFATLGAGLSVLEATLPPPTRTPTDAQLKVAITRDLWSEVQALRAIVAESADHVPQADLAAIKIALEDIRDSVASLEVRTGRPVVPLLYEAILYMRSDRYDGPAAYQVFLDNEMVAGGVVNDTPESGPLGYELRIRLDPTNRTLSVRFSNDAYGGSADRDRNMYLTAIIVTGKPHLTLTAATLDPGVERLPGGMIKFLSNGAATFKLR